MVFKQKKNQHGLAALAHATIKLARAQVVLDKTEAALERELEKEEKSLPKTKLQKVRKKGEHVIHSKHLLLMVVFLNVIDCLLVLGELMLDIKYVTDLLHKEHERDNEFIGTMKGLYPEHLGFLLPGDIEILETEIIKAHLTWDTSHAGATDTHHSDITVDPHEDGGENDTTNNYDDTSRDPDISTTTAADNSTGHHARRRRSSISQTSSDETPGDGESAGHEEEHHAEHGHSLEEEIAHALHKASITILGILVAETICKVFCLGKDMLDHKLECFDGVIVLASFIVDLVLLKGLQQFAVQDFVLILAFLVPWRIIRVVNSLVVAIMDHEHFRLKLLYKQKKKISNDLKNAKTEIKGLEACISALETMCKEAGIPETNIQAKLLLYRKTQSKNNAMSALAGFAIGGEAMKKPILWEPPKDVHVITVDSADTETKNSSPTLAQDTLHEVAKQTVVTACDVIEPQGSPVIERLRKPDLRTRSYSAIEPGQKHGHKLTPNSVRKLAEASAGFIATMHRDDTDKIGGSLSQHENVNEKETREDKSKEKENTPKEDEEKLKDHSQIHQTEGSDASNQAVNFL